MYKRCKSCGIPLNKDPKGGGSEKDGSLSDRFCSYCYKNGAFTFEGTVEDFQEFCRRKMIEGGHNRFFAWLMTRGMKHLPRWKNKV